MGSGSLPTQNLPTRLVAVQSENRRAGRARVAPPPGEPPIFARVHKGQVLLDPRTLLEGEEPLLVEGVISVLRRN